MLGKSFGILVIFSVIFAAASGNLSSLSDGVIDGASSAVTVVLSLVGMMCLWSGIMNVLYEAGITGWFSNLAAPILSRLFPDAYKRGVAKEEITSAVTANLLGIGNAATPLSLSAMKKMDSAAVSEYATDDMIMLTLTSISPISLIPTTLITLRKAAGSSSPYEVIVPVWICSVLTFLFTVFAAKICSNFFPQKEVCRDG